MDTGPGLFKGVEDTLKRLGDARDGLLVVGALLYGAGYCAWSLHAFLNHLGPAAGLDPQYFLAGIPVLLLLAVAWPIGSWLSRLAREEWPAWIGGLTSSERKKALIGFIAFICLSVLTAWIRYGNSPPEVFGLRPFWVSVMSMAIFALPFSRVFLPPWFGHLFMGGKRSFSAYAWALILCLAAGLPYLGYAYPMIPQVLGGAKPRAAEVDLVVDRMAADSLRTLVAGELTAKVVRSKRLFVYFNSRDVLVASLEEAKPHKPQIMLEIKQDAIAAVRWVE